MITRLRTVKSEVSKSVLFRQDCILWPGDPRDQLSQDFRNS